TFRMQSGRAMKKLLIHTRQVALAAVAAATVMVGVPLHAQDRAEGVERPSPAERRQMRGPQAGQAAAPADEARPLKPGARAEAGPDNARPLKPGARPEAGSDNARSLR